MVFLPAAAMVMHKAVSELSLAGLVLPAGAQPGTLHRQ
jgi:hypothetical protein